MVSTKPQSSKRNSLLPYEGEKGQPIKSLQEIAQEPAFFPNYTIHWSALKRPTGPYFTWLWQCQVFLNPTNFKTDTLIACGFLVGAHLGFLW
jgi:hypothetical protein